LDVIAAAKLARRNESDKQRLAVMQAELETEVNAYKSRWGAVTPELVNAITSLGDKQLATSIAENLPKSEGALGMLLGVNGIDQLKKVLAGTAAERGLDALRIGAKSSDKDVD